MRNQDEDTKSTKHNRGDQRNPAHNGYKGLAEEALEMSLLIQPTSSVDMLGCDDRKPAQPLNMGWVNGTTSTDQTCIPPSRRAANHSISLGG